jgi:ATP synthase protein I
MEEPFLKKKHRKDPEKNQENDGLKSYARFTALGFQMIIIILVSVWGGIKLDKLFGFANPIFTVILSLLGVFAAIYAAVKDFIK